MTFLEREMAFSLEASADFGDPHGPLFELNGELNGEPVFARGRVEW